jgi:hypothetical protein
MSLDHTSLMVSIAKAMLKTDVTTAAVGTAARDDHGSSSSVSSLLAPVRHGSSSSSVSSLDTSARDKATRIIAKLAHEREVEILSLFSNPSTQSVTDWGRLKGWSEEKISEALQLQRKKVTEQRTKQKLPTLSPQELETEADKVPVVNLDLMREMRLMQKQIESEDCIMLSGTTVKDFERILSRVSPRILQFSGHAEDRTLVFESDETGKSEFLQVPQMQDMLRQSNLSSLEIIFLNCCNGRGFAEGLVTTPATAHLAVICWDESVGNKAASFFAECWYIAIGKQLRKDSVTLFNEACAQFCKDGRYKLPLQRVQKRRSFVVEPVLIRCADGAGTGAGDVPLVSTMTRSPSASNAAAMAAPQVLMTRYQSNEKLVALQNQPHAANPHEIPPPNASARSPPTPRQRRWAKYVAHCQSCNFELKAHYKFCYECGTKV